MRDLIRIQIELASGIGGFCIASIAFFILPELARRGFLDQLFEAVAGRFTVAIADGGAAGRRQWSSFRLFFLNSL